jgi:long-chain acyl-CoA synthetase
MSFVANILDGLEGAGDTPILQELRDGQAISVTARGLLGMVQQARAFIADKNIPRGQRCGLLAHNSIRWVAADLAIMAEGLIVVPLYARQAAAELVSMMKDCSPALVVCGDDGLGESIKDSWSETPPMYLFDEMFAKSAASHSLVNHASSSKPTDPVTIIYTSGTSGDAKGVVLTAANVGHMLKCTSSRLSVLMQNSMVQDRVYHYLPFCFAGSWITLLTCLLRRSLLVLNTDLSKIAAEMRTVGPHYFLNVPALLERMRKAVDEQLWKTGGVALSIYTHSKAAWFRKHEKRGRFMDSIWLALARGVVFPTIRKKMIGSNLKALICGSAPLNVETQLYFMMIGIPVLQVYGLTETTAICTMDYPQQVEPGRVGPAIDGIEMKLAANEEIVVRGPNIFPGYWNHPAETEAALRDGWFHTGDQGEVDAIGNWRIVGRIKNLIILGSGHNISPEPIEEELLKNIFGAQQVVLVGNGQGYLSAIITGKVSPNEAQAAIDAVNKTLPHYKQVRAFHVSADPFSIENGLLTANGKLKRNLIAAQMKPEIESMYAVRQVS